MMRFSGDIHSNAVSLKNFELPVHWAETDIVKRYGRILPPFNDSLPGIISLRLFAILCG